MPSNPVKTAALAMGKVIVAAVKGEPLLVDDATVKHREATCKQCSRWRPKTNRCSVCKCYLILKVQLKTESCPLKKW